MSAEKDAEVTAEIACAKRADAINAAREDTSSAIARDAPIQAALQGLDHDQVLIQVGVEVHAEEADTTEEAAAEEMREMEAEDTEEVPVQVNQEVAPQNAEVAKEAEPEVQAAAVDLNLKIEREEAEVLVLVAIRDQNLQAEITNHRVLLQVAVMIIAMKRKIIYHHPV